MEVMSHSSSFLLPADEASAKRYALIVLNQNLPRFTPLVWEHVLEIIAKLRLCADGGANRIYDELPLFFPREDALLIRNRYKPDVIKGDMDSIRPDVLHFYLSLGTKVIDESHDQDTTDLDKCILFIRDSPLNQESSKGHSGEDLIMKPYPYGSNYGLYMFYRLKADTEMRFGGLVSTSNLVKGEKIRVESDSDLLWTISIKKQDPNKTLRSG
ncbi:hypothetical protein F2Q68_00038184 [Brassica cretica]|uniref:Thiamine diphosphokinase n=1 Tax=Brassica cretica TaxID=69181 RepID=A0A8S9MKS9_BRACR|nr:hypothetical protein F2Q68_00038184 [Brassica cretica]